MGDLIKITDEVNGGKQAIITKLPEDRNLITALVGDSQHAFIASDSGNVFKLSLKTGDISIIATVNRVWSLVCRANSLAFSSLSGEVHFVKDESPFVSAAYKVLFPFRASNQIV